MSKPLSQPKVSFGSFEVNPRTGELRKQGLHIKLHEKPLQVLLTLLEHPSEGYTSGPDKPGNRPCGYWNNLSDFPTYQGTTLLKMPHL